MGARGVTHKLTLSASPGKKSQGRGPKEIGGSLHKQWSVWFNSKVHVEPYQPPSPTVEVVGRRHCMAVVGSCLEVCRSVDKRAQPQRGRRLARHRWAEVKSLWSISVGRHTRYTGRDKGTQAGNGAQAPKVARVRIAACNSAA